MRWGRHSIKAGRVGLLSLPNNGEGGGIILLCNTSMNELIDRSDNLSLSVSSFYLSTYLINRYC